MQNHYQFFIPRLDGNKIEKNIKHHLSLVKKGIAGFIVFGGELRQIRENIKRLQYEAKLPLIIASDLEQGLGQQIKGGTIFPPAMAVASAIKKNAKSLSLNNSPGLVVSAQKLKLLRNTFKLMAIEARYTGINTILAPVLDINTNHNNPIISVRAFGEDRKTVSFFGCEMIETIQGCGLATCGKHFPGHGDTEVDSHIRLPAINKDINTLNKRELQPFKKAIKAAVKMLMLGHLDVPSIDPSGIPVSISEKAVNFLRERMKYKGIIITDAFNMGGIGKYSEEKAAAIALEAGVDVILHPTDAEKIVSYLRRKNVEFNADRLNEFRSGLFRFSTAKTPDFLKHMEFSRKLTENAIKISGNIKVKGTPFIVILSDDKNEKGKVFIQRLKEDFPDLRSRILNRDSLFQKVSLPDNAFVIVSIFSATKAWKGGPGRWLYEKISSLKDSADLFISFGSPYLLENIKNVAKIIVFWASDSAQDATAQLIKDNK
jgi:beta-glucosidase-like glycosyl hydrolase